MPQSIATPLSRRRLLTLAIAAAVLLMVGPAWAAEEIKIGGTGNALGAMRLVADAFVKQNPDIKVTVLPSVGTSGAIKGVPRGAIDIGLSARPLTEEERLAGAVSLEYARTPLVFAVSSKTQVSAMTVDQIADMYSGKTPNWPDGRPVRPIMRQPGDSSTAQLMRVYPALDKALRAAEVRPGLSFATTDQEAADKLESIAGAVGTTTLTLITSESRALRPLTLNGVEPTVQNLASGRYPDAALFFLIARTNPSPAATRFIGFVQSGAGRDILTRAGNWVP